MRGLEEIKERNEHPHGFHGDSNEHEQFRPSQRRLSDDVGEQRPTLQKILEAITGGQKTHLDLATDTLKRLSETGADISPTGRRGKLLTELFVAASILDQMGIPAPTDLVEKMDSRARTLADRSRLNDKGDRVSSEGERFLGMDGIHSSLGELPGFMSFWSKLNDERAAAGQGEAMYREAKKLYVGGEAPKGALTFIGKEWNGLRAVPAKKYEGRKTYHAEFSSIAPEGNTIWNVVSNTNSDPISYADAEAALHGARHARIHSEALKH